MSVVMCVRTVRAMARLCAIATVVTVLLASCRSSRDVTSQSDVHKIVRTIDTLVTVRGGEAQMIADVSVSEGKLTIGGVSTTGEGVQLSARIEERGGGTYQLVVDADVADREVHVVRHEEMIDVVEYNNEERHQESSRMPVWAVVATVVVLLTLIIVVLRWMKK